MADAVRVDGVTVLFCDLVGSTALLAQIGEAANDELRRDLFEALRQPIDVHHGREVKSQGDGLMVSFTRSWSDAVGCARAMQRAVGRLSSAANAPPLRIRVGISRGEVTAEDDDWFGTPVVEAARLCGLAQAGQILITEHSLPPDDHRGDGTPSVGSLVLKGFPQPVPCSEVRYDPPPANGAPVPLPPPLDLEGHLPIAGMSGPLAELDRLWHAVMDGGTRVAVVSGPPRSGRTRLTAEFAARVMIDSPSVLHGTTPRAGRPHAALREAVRRFAMTAPLEIVERLDEIEGLAALVPAVGTRLGRPLEQPGDLPGPRAVSSIVSAALRVITSYAPVLLVLEDLQWADDATMDCLLTMLETASLGRLFTVVTNRITDELEGRRLSSVIGSLSFALHVQWIETGGVSRDELAALLASGADALVTEDTIDRVIETVGSLPGDVVEAAGRLAEADAGDPDSVARTLSLCVPYKGLVALGADDRGVFFGRDHLVDDIVERLHARRFVAVVGASGSGKSSVLRAGVAARFEAMHTSVAVVTPSDPTALQLALETPRHTNGLIIDQFEELFSLWEESARRRVLDQLFEVLDDDVAWVAIALRSDFFGRCAEHTALSAQVSESTMLVGRVTEDELRSIIEGPARAARLSLESGFTDVVLADLAGDARPLPLVSHALYEAWRRRSHDQLVVDDYRAAGGVRGSIARTAENVYAHRLDDDGQRIAKELLSRLVELSDDGTPTRHPLGNALASETFGPGTDAVLETLVSARLLVTDGEFVDLAHEALLTEWPRLALWIVEDQEALRGMVHLDRAAHEWETNDRVDADLYRGARLETAVELERSGKPLTPVERNFLNASLDARERERLSLRKTNRRLRRQLVGALVALTVAAVATVVAVSQLRTADRQRRAAELSLLASSAKDLASSQVDVAGLLATEANRLRPDGESLDALVSVLRTRPEVARSIYPPFLSDASQLLDVSADGRVALFYDGTDLTTMDTGTLDATSTLELDDVRAAGLSPSGDRVAVATSDQLSTFRSGDAATLTPLPSGGPASFIDSDLLWLDESRILVAPGSGHGVRTIDVETGDATSVSDTSERMIAAFDPTNHRVALVPAVNAGLRRSIPVFTATPPSGPATAVGRLDTGGATNVAFSADGTWLGVSTFTGLRLVNVASNAFDVVDLPKQRAVSSTVAFDSSSTHMAVLDATGELVLYALSGTDPPNEVLRATAAGATRAFFGPGAGLLYLATGDHLVVVATDGREPLATAPFGDATEAPLTVSPDGVLVGMISGVTGAMHTVDLRTGQIRLDHFVAESYPQFYTEDGSSLIGVGFTNARTAGFLEILDKTDGSIEHRAAESFDPRTQILADQKVTIVGQYDRTGSRAVFFEVPSLATVSVLTLEPMDAAVMLLSNDGTSLVRYGTTAEGEAFEIFDRTTGHELRPAIRMEPGHSPVTEFALSPDGGEIVYGDAAAAIGIIDISTGTITGHAFAGSPGPVSQLAYTSDGSRLLGITRAGDLQWWDTASRRTIGGTVAAFPGATDITGTGTDAAKPISDNLLHFIAVPTEDGIRQWNFDITTWPTIACRRAGRNLTRAEWAQYLPAGEPYHVTCPEYPAD